MVEPEASAFARLLVCFSHLRWDLVFQRPQHLLTRAARDFSVLYVEEPQRGAVAAPELKRRRHVSGVEVVTPVLPEGAAAPIQDVRRLLDARLAQSPSCALHAWYYTPMALDYSDHLTPDVTIYDCMDELSAFKNPPAGLVEREDGLFARADIVFTGGLSLYAAKRQRHPHVFAFPSSVDVHHFGRARASLPDPSDQAGVPRPRIGFFGVIDERMDLSLVARTARRCRDVQFVMLGPVVKIDPDALPRGPNLHWLGPKSYDELPAYLANWNAGWMPFALNASTRFISPTKTPEFLAAGLPLVSTAVADVVRTYGSSGLVAIANDQTMAEKLRAALAPPADKWRARVEAHLAGASWDRTWSEMNAHIARIEAQQAPLRQRGA
jgi:glycosyltransferase involved in cell wall biosynthesis